MRPFLNPYFLICMVSLASSKGVALLSKKVLVTGANKGIGKAICKKILETQPDVHVLLGSRDLQRGTVALENLKRELKSTDASAGDRISCIHLDVTSDESVSAAVLQVKEAVAADLPLYGIVNNAGVGFGLSVTDTLAVNLYGTRRVSEAFIPLLDSVEGRVVNIGSASGPMFVSGSPNRDLATSLSDPTIMPTTFEALETIIADAFPARDGPDYDGSAYGLSKACLMAYTTQLAKRFPNLRINACTPGYINTDLTAGMGATNPPEKGTKAPLYCLFGDVPFQAEGGINGRYYGSDGVRSPLDCYRGPGDPAYDP